jgi:hypothetical protein
MTVNGFIPQDGIPADMSRVRVSKDWFPAFATSEDIIRARRWKPNSQLALKDPILEPLQTGVLIAGQYYNVYDANGNDVFYRKDNKDTAISPKTGDPVESVFLMYTDVATKIHVPVAEGGTEIVEGTRYVRPTVVA